ncbi:hypothetical protein GTW51_18875 [Aurantimonas aggregata]|uniref:Uncharacterized protein n=1 Tax=Aurantimonas aggregata TaxID=2047720 RepID=A0A6L9MLI8_9HYPH|nr:hypothetical protein [Aurantimonas aggregata]NDV88764.1 hypothetical protein [Aurantimonas aggregata]
MDDIDFTLPADIFWARSARRVLPKGGLAHKRFDTLADAICHVMQGDEIPRYSLSIDTDDASFTLPEIEEIFKSEPFAPYRQGTDTVASAK